LRKKDQVGHRQEKSP